MDQKRLASISAGVFLLRYGKHFPYTVAISQTFSAVALSAFMNQLSQAKQIVSPFVNEVNKSCDGKMSIAALVRLAYSKGLRYYLLLFFTTVDVDKLLMSLVSMGTIVSSCILSAVFDATRRLGLGLNLASLVCKFLIAHTEPLLFPSAPVSALNENDGVSDSTRDPTLAVAPSSTELPLLKLAHKAVCVSIGVFAALRLEKVIMQWSCALTGAELLILNLDKRFSPMIPILAGSSLVVNYAFPSVGLTRVEKAALWLPRCAERLLVFFSLCVRSGSSVLTGGLA